MKIEGNIVDVLNEKIFSGEIFIEGKKILKVIKNNKKYKNFILPGFIDAHIHIESSLLSPESFTKETLKHGTTSVIADCHEIANVFGVKGIKFMMKASALVLLKIYFSLPSCVPATPFENTGIKIGPKEIRKLIKLKRIVALGEMMNFPGVIKGDKEVMKKIKIAKLAGKPIDGHAPLLSGKDLRKYIAAGISTDHECTTLKEAKEKMRLGAKIMLREGSAAKNLKDLIGLDYNNCFLVSDDIEAKDLVLGHLDRTVKKAIRIEVPLMKAIKMVTLNPAEHYNLNSGVIAPGKYADLIEVENLKNFKIKRVLIDGKLVVKNGKVLFSPKQLKTCSEFYRTTCNELYRTTCSESYRTTCGELCRTMGKNIKAKKVDLKNFAIYSRNKKEVIARVIKVIPNQILTGQKFARLKIKNGEVLANPQKDILKIIVVNRYGKRKIGKGFVNGFGFKKGAIASSISHDSHNLMAVGTDDKSTAKAINTVITNGGLALVNNKKVFNLKLPLAGLMSLKRAKDVAEELEILIDETKKLGSKLKNPFVTLSFLALLVIPKLKISDRGLFDVEKFCFVNNFID